MTTPADEKILAVLERARTVGLLGPGPLRVHLEHARCFEPALDEGVTRMIDLGSGGGLPGLPIFLDRTSLEGALLDASARRCAFLTWAVFELGLRDRVEVIEGRAEELAHTDLRASFDAAVCRGFGPPAITVECAMPFVRRKGVVVISEPPERRPWPEAQLTTLGLTVSTKHRSVVTFTRTGELDARLPRKAKLQQRDPLFRFSE